MKFHRFAVAGRRGCVLVFSAIGGFASAQPPPAATVADPRALEEVVVKGQLIDSGRQAFSTDSFAAVEIREMELSRISELLDNVSGVSIRRFGLPGVADSITIRGFGGGGHGGDLGVVLDGVPLNEAMSHADGYVDMSVVVPLEIRELTVFKGPVSALYGNYNRGGLVKIDTRSGGSYRQLDLSAGSDGLVDLQAALGGRLGSAQHANLALQHFRTNGYRPQSDSEQTTLAGRWRTELRDHTQLALSGRWYTADSDNPGYLTEAQYLTDSYGIDPNMHNDGADKDFGTARIDLNHELAEDVKLLSFVYGTTQDFSRWFTRPVGVGGPWQQREESYERDVWGAGVSFNGDQRWADVPIRWVTGIEAFGESTRYEYYEGLDQRARTAPAVNDRETGLDTFSAFAELQADWDPRFMLSVGLRYDRFSGDCEAAGPETGTSPCDDLNGLDEFSPKLGVRSALLETLEARASYAEGFSLPGGWIKYQPEASNLDAVTFRQYEVGLTWTPAPRLELDMAAYQIDSDGEVRTVAPGVFENYGETERTGVESALTWYPHESLSLAAVYGTTDAEVVRSGDPALVGNDVGGVADYSVTVRGEWHFLPAWQVNVTWRAVGPFALNDGNSAYSDGYDLIDIGLVLSRNELWSAYARIDNVTDETYAPSQFIIGGSRLYGPGAPRQLRFGLQMDF